MPKRLKNDTSKEKAQIRIDRVVGHAGDIALVSRAPEDDSDTKAIISAYLKVLGAERGKVSGAKRTEVPKRTRTAVVKKAAEVKSTKK